jgi:hypothetical protein
VTKLVYRALVTLYPWDYATVFSEDMKITFDQACEEYRIRGRWQFVCFAATEVFSLLCGVGKEWLAKLTTEESVRGRSLPDLRKMRPVGIAYEVWFASLDCSGRVKFAID